MGRKDEEKEYTLKIQMQAEKKNDMNSFQMYQRKTIFPIKSNSMTQQKNNIILMQFQVLAVHQLTVFKNEGYMKRKKVFTESKWVNFCINYICYDITTLPKYILQSREIEMELQRTSDKFCHLFPNKTGIFPIQLEDIKVILNHYLPSK